ncbi:uncharacterized protein LOC127159183 [Labeo rohita]|uniref:uncharacterized protein LOC127159183 n=1 Tax=Labeo rohita TaxID=84645 RepID=UPI0021E2F1AE|nr:uncharacterized protein LOC127159183 [Labeo rohita]
MLLLSLSYGVHYTWRMKTFMKTLVFLMLCCALQLSTSTGPSANDIANSICCFNKINYRIPLKRLKSYFWTGSSCPLTHIVLVTVPRDSTTQKQFCTDPKEKWVQRAINYLDKKNIDQWRSSFMFTQKLFHHLYIKDCWQFTTYSYFLCLLCGVYQTWRMKTFMKTSLVFLMLCCALQLNTSAGIRAVMSVNSICCFKEINIRIPLKRLVSYLWTSNSCPFKHIVFVTAPDPKKKDEGKDSEESFLYGS